MTNLISDYLDYNSGNECPRIYHEWSVFSLIAIALGRGVFIRLGGDEAYEELTIVPEIYVCLVGLQGSRKTFAKDVALNIALKYLNVPVTASVETGRSLSQFLASDDCERSFTDHQGNLKTIRPMFLAIDELKNFLSVDPIRLVDLLVGIYGRKDYVYRTAHKGTDIIENPCLNVLACATTEFIVDQLRDKILSGGLARRMLFVNVAASVQRNGDPKIPTGGREKIDRVIKHLVWLSSNFVGEFKWKTEEDFTRYQLWYESVIPPEDGLMHGFTNSKHIQAYKLCMILAAAEYEPKLDITFNNYQRALTYIEALEPGMAKLFAGAGRNELAAPMLALLDIVEKGEVTINGKAYPGIITKKKLLSATENNLGTMEQMNVLSHLRTTERIYSITANFSGSAREFILLKATYELLQEDGLIVKAG